MTDVAVVVLIGQEKIHLARCVEKLAALAPRQVFLVESQPDDGGVAIARETAARLGLCLESKYHRWPGNQAEQFNWALDNLPIEAGWVLRLDADEYLTDATAERLRSGAGIADDVCGITLELKRKFLGGEIRHGTNGIRQVRMFRRGKGRYPQSLMDERFVVDGKVVDFDGAFYDDNLNGFGWWRQKHLGYVRREASQAVHGTFSDPRKCAYYKMPRYVRAVSYFCVRYFLKGGVLDGLVGWRWNFWQGLWYRWLVDREIGNLRRIEARRQEEGAKVRLQQYRNRHGGKLKRLLWEVSWAVAGRTTPRWALNGWRRLLLSAFGAKIGCGGRFHGGALVWQPWRLRIGENSWIDRDVNLYSVDDIVIGHDAVVSEGAFICTAGHDLTSAIFALTNAPVEIGDYAWVCSRAIVLPGVKVGEGAVVAAGAVVTKDVEPWTVVGGNPAKFIKKRVMTRQSGTAG